jgi:predicted MFS family arabinose efflux permease
VRLRAGAILQTGVVASDKAVGGIERKRPPSWREVFAGKRGRLTAGLLILEALYAIEALMVVTILPAIRADLGGLPLYGWVLAASSFGAFGAIPVGGRAADKFGPRRPLAVLLAMFGAGLAAAALAPSMLFVALGRFLQGMAAGGLYAVSLGAVAKTYPPRLRPRVLALLASMWILPGLCGPPLGALLATAFGWRWAFVAPMPVLAICAWLVLPALPASGRTESAPLPLRWPLQLTVGAGLFLAGLSHPAPASFALCPAGLVLAIPALARIVPPGTFRARRGIPAAAAAAFLLSAAFFAVDGFVPLMLTGVRGFSVAAASVVVSAATVAWSIGSWWQSRRAEAWSAAALVRLGAALIAAGAIAVTGGLLGLPVVTVYLGWTVAGVGMGIAFPTIPLAVMGAATGGDEAGQLSSSLLMDTLGVAMGAGLGGASVALAKAAGAGLPAGLTGAFLLGAGCAALVMMVAHRLPRKPQGPRESPVPTRYAGPGEPGGREGS